MSKKPSTDSELVDAAPDNLASLASAFNWQTIKVAGFLFFIMLILCSDVFVQRVLAFRNDQLVTAGTPTSFGVVTQSGLMAIAYIGINTLVGHGWV